MNWTAIVLFRSAAHWLVELAALLLFSNFCKGRSLSRAGWIDADHQKTLSPTAAPTFAEPVRAAQPPANPRPDANWGDCTSTHALCEASTH